MCLREKEGENVKAIWKKAAGLLCMVMLIFMMIPAAGAAAKDVVIVLDPGHGGTEAGARRTWNGYTYREEIITLKIAEYAKQELEKYEGVKVYLTRSSNVGPAMDRATRVNIAKKKKADALVSLHINSTGEYKTAQSGALAMVPSSRYGQSYAKETRILAKSILSELGMVGLSNRGFGYDDELGIILYGMKAKIPSMIIEHCFVNNPQDCRKYLRTSSGLKKLGVADATGIAKYYKLKKKGASSEPSVPVKTGWQSKNGKKQYFYSDGTMAKNGWKKISSKYYYFDKSGYLKTGVIKIGKSLYLTDKNGIRKKGFIQIEGKQYYADSQGKLYTGWKTYKSKKYYFDKKTGAAYTGKRKIGSKTYFFSNSTKTPGVMKSKIIKISGRKYFFSRKDGRMMVNYWVKVSGKWYYFGKDGAAYANVRKKIKGKTYRFDAEGVCLNKK